MRVKLIVGIGAWWDSLRRKWYTSRQHNGPGALSQHSALPFYLEMHIWKKYYISSLLSTTTKWECRKQLNSMWPSNAIWRHRSGSTLVQVMACCLMAPSHYLNQCWLSSNAFCGIHLTVMSQEVFINLIRGLYFYNWYPFPRGQWYKIVSSSSEQSHSSPDGDKARSNEFIGIANMSICASFSGSCQCILCKHGGTTEEGNCSYLLPLYHRGKENL